FTLDLLKSVREIYGPNAPEKLLYNLFEKKTAALKSKAKGETVAERAKWLARFREGEGYMAQFSSGDEGGPRIVECHSPILNLLEQYPISSRIAEAIVTALLGTQQPRQELP